MPTQNSPSVSSQQSQYEIPAELQEVLLDFTVQFLIEQPRDLVTFALDYFTRLHQSRRGQGAPEGIRGMGVQYSPSSAATRVSTTNSVLRPDQNHSEEDESMQSDDDISNYGYVSTRRKSVFAETYDPEDDDDKDEKIIHPKSDSQRKSLLEAVKEILLFRSLESEQLNEVLDAMFEKKVTPNEYIIKQGDDGDFFYVVESGIYNIFIKQGTQDVKVGCCENKGSFGELALMYNMPRAATIQSAGDGMLWAMDRQTFRRIVLRNAFQKRKMYEALLEKVPLLSSLNPYERMNLADALTSKHYKKESAIIHQGDPADGMYFVETGEVSVTVVGNDGSERQVTTISEGGYFGELALVTHKARAATVTANADEVRVAFLDVNAFERLLGPCMDVMKDRVDDYEDQLVRIFGSKANISDIR